MNEHIHFILKSQMGNFGSTFVTMQNCLTDINEILTQNEKHINDKCFSKTRGENSMKKASLL